VSEKYASAMQISQMPPICGCINCKAAERDIYVLIIPCGIRGQIGFAIRLPPPH